MTISENSVALLIQVDEGNFEVVMKLYVKGKLLEPKDENWGCWCWSSYTLEHALEIYNEITDGRRGIRSMVEEI